MMTKASYCPNCHRIIGIGCACGLSLREKNVSIDKHSLTVDHQAADLYDEKHGGRERRRQWAKEKLNERT